MIKTYNKHINDVYIQDSSDTSNNTSLFAEAFAYKGKQYLLIVPDLSVLRLLF